MTAPQTSFTLSGLHNRVNVMQAMLNNGEFASSGGGGGGGGGGGTISETVIRPVTVDTEILQYEGDVADINRHSTIDPVIRKRKRRIFENVTGTSSGPSGPGVGDVITLPGTGDADGGNAPAAVSRTSGAVTATNEPILKRRLLGSASVSHYAGLNFSATTGFHGTQIAEHKASDTTYVFGKVVGGTGVMTFGNNVSYNTGNITTNHEGIVAVRINPKTGLAISATRIIQTTSSVLGENTLQIGGVAFDDDGRLYLGVNSNLSLLTYHLDQTVNVTTSQVTLSVIASGRQCGFLLSYKPTSSNIDGGEVGTVDRANRVAWTPNVGASALTGIRCDPVTKNIWVQMWRSGFERTEALPSGDTLNIGTLTGFGTVTTATIMSDTQLCHVEYDALGTYLRAESVQPQTGTGKILTHQSVVSGAGSSSYWNYPYGMGTLPDGSHVIVGAYGAGMYTSEVPNYVYRVGNLDGTLSDIYLPIDGTNTSWVYHRPYIAVYNPDGKCRWASPMIAFESMQTNTSQYAYGCFVSMKGHVYVNYRWETSTVPPADIQPLNLDGTPAQTGTWTGQFGTYSMILKYDGISGKFMGVARSAVGSNMARAFWMAEDPLDGSVYHATYTHTTISTYPQTDFLGNVVPDGRSTGVHSGLITKYSSDGTYLSHVVIWRASYHNYILGIDVDLDGNVYAKLRTNAPVDIPHFSSGTSTRSYGENSTLDPGGTGTLQRDGIIIWDRTGTLRHSWMVTINSNYSFDYHTNFENNLKVDHLGNVYVALYTQRSSESVTFTVLNRDRTASRFSESSSYYFGNVIKYDRDGRVVGLVKNLRSGTTNNIFMDVDKSDGTLYVSHWPYGSTHANTLQNMDLSTASGWTRFTGASSYHTETFRFDRHGQLTGYYPISTPTSSSSSNPYGLYVNQYTGSVWDYGYDYSTNPVNGINRLGSQSLGFIRHIQGRDTYPHGLVRIGNADNVPMTIARRGRTISLLSPQSSWKDRIIARQTPELGGKFVAYYDTSIDTLTLTCAGKDTRFLHPLPTNSTYSERVAHESSSHLSSCEFLVDREDVSFSNVRGDPGIPSWIHRAVPANAISRDWVSWTQDGQWLQAVSRTSHVNITASSTRADVAGVPPRSPYFVTSNDISESSMWSSQSGMFGVSDGIYLGTSRLGGYSGEWIRFDLKEARGFPKMLIKPSHLDRAPLHYIVLGLRNSGSDTWDVLANRTSESFSATITNVPDSRTINLELRGTYEAYAIVFVRKTSGVDGNGEVGLSFLQFYEREVSGVSDTRGESTVMEIYGGAKVTVSSPDTSLMFVTCNRDMSPSDTQPIHIHRTRNDPGFSIPNAGNVSAVYVTPSDTNGYFTGTYGIKDLPMDDVNLLAWASHAESQTVSMIVRNTEASQFTPSFSQTGGGIQHHMLRRAIYLNVVELNGGLAGSQITRVGPASAHKIGTITQPTLEYGDTVPFIRLGNVDNTVSTTDGNWIEFGEQWLPRNEMTFVGVFRLRTIVGGTRVFDFGNDTTGNNIFLAVDNNSPQLRLHVYRGTEARVSDPIDIQENVWMTCIVSFNRTKILLVCKPSEGANAIKTTVEVTDPAKMWGSEIGPITLTHTYIGRSVVGGSIPFTQMDVRDMSWHDAWVNEDRVDMIITHLEGKWTSSGVGVEYPRYGRITLLTYNGVNGELMSARDMFGMATWEHKIAVARVSAGLRANILSRISPASYDMTHASLTDLDTTPTFIKGVANLTGGYFTALHIDEVSGHTLAGGYGLMLQAGQNTLSSPSGEGPLGFLMDLDNPDIMSTIATGSITLDKISPVPNYTREYYVSGTHMSSLTYSTMVGGVSIPQLGTGSSVWLARVKINDPSKIDTTTMTNALVESFINAQTVVGNPEDTATNHTVETLSVDSLGNVVISGTANGPTRAYRFSNGLETLHQIYSGGLYVLSITSTGGISRLFRATTDSTSRTIVGSYDAADRFWLSGTFRSQTTIAGIGELGEPGTFELVNSPNVPPNTDAVFVSIWNLSGTTPLESAWVASRSINGITTARGLFCDPHVWLAWAGGDETNVLFSHTGATVMRRDAGVSRGLAFYRTPAVAQTRPMDVARLGLTTDIRVEKSLLYRPNASGVTSIIYFIGTHRSTRGIRVPNFDGTLSKHVIPPIETNTPDNTDVFVVKYTESGECTAAFNLAEGSGRDIVNGAKINETNGDLYVFGTTDARVRVGGKEIPAVAGTAWLAGINLNGDVIFADAVARCVDNNFEWERIFTLRGSDSDNAGSVAVSSSTGTTAFAYPDHVSLVNPDRDIDMEKITAQNIALLSKMFEPEHIIQISLSNNHAIALTREGAVYTWGNNNSGCIGRGDTGSIPCQMHPYKVNIPGKVVSVNAGSGSHSGTSFAILDTGSFYSWGYNGHGQLGHGTSGSNTGTPTLSTHISNVKKIASDLYLGTLFLLRDGTCRFTGHYMNGNRGGGTSNSSATQTTAYDPGVSGIIDIAGGYGHWLALQSDGAIRSWGNNGTGQLGDGGTTSDGTIRTVSGISTATSIAAGYSTSYAVLADGTVRSWGFNINGTLGNGSSSGGSNQLTPVTVSVVRDVTRIAASNRCAIAYNDSGNVAFGWGNTTDTGGSPIGLSAGTNVLTPVPVPLTNVRQFAMHTHSCLALHRDGKLMGTGVAYKNIIGTGIRVHSIASGAQGIMTHLPTFVESVEVNHYMTQWIIQVLASNTFAMALTRDGSVYIWGSGGSGAMGDNTSSNTRIIPFKLNIPAKVVRIAGGFAVGAGASSHFAITETGRYYGWGYNGHGQLGPGIPTGNPTVPTLSTATNVDDIAFNMYLDVNILYRNGTTTTYGSNGYNHFSSFSSVVKVSGGYGHYIALGSNGIVSSTGYNNYGQLGNGNQTNQSSVVTAGTVTYSVIDISTGYNHSIAILSNGTGMGWGADHYGSLGRNVTNGGWTAYPSASGVVSLNNVNRVSTGYWCSIAYNIYTGYAMGWGYVTGSSGDELGLGSSNRTVATQLSITDIVGASVSQYMSIILRRNGIIMGSGNGGSYQLGDGASHNPSSFQYSRTAVRDIYKDIGSTSGYPTASIIPRALSVKGYRMYVGVSIPSMTNLVSFDLRGENDASMFPSAILRSYDNEDNNVDNNIPIRSIASPPSSSFILYLTNDSIRTVTDTLDREISYRNHTFTTSAITSSSFACSDTIVAVGIPASEQVVVYNLGSDGVVSAPVATLQDTVVSAGNSFGEAIGVARFGDTDVICVGTPGKTVGTFSGAGGLSIFVRSGSSAWPTTPTLTISPPTSATNIRFGASIALSGSPLRVTVGAPGNNGVAYVFEWTGTGSVTSASNWVIRTTFAPPRNGTSFGTSVGLSGDTVAVGGRDMFAARLKPAVSNPTVTEVREVSRHTLEESPDTYALMFDDNTVIVGDPSDASNAGVVRIYDRRMGTTADLVGTLQSMETQYTATRFGEHLRLRGGLLVVLAPRYGYNIGAVYVYRRNPDGTWPDVHTNKIIDPKTPPDPLGNQGARSSFGMDGALETDGVSLVISDPVAQIVYIYHKPEQLEPELKTLTALVATRVAIAHTELVLANPANNTVWVYNTTPSTPTLSRTWTSGVLTDSFGDSVAIFRDTIAVGASAGRYIDLFSRDVAGVWSETAFQRISHVGTSFGRLIRLQERMMTVATATRLLIFHRPQSTTDWTMSPVMTIDKADDGWDVNRDEVAVGNGDTVTMYMMRNRLSQHVEIHDVEPDGDGNLYVIGGTNANVIGVYDLVPSMNGNQVPIDIVPNVKDNLFVLSYDSDMKLNYRNASVRSAGKLSRGRLRRLTPTSFWVSGEASDSITFHRLDGAGTAGALSSPYQYVSDTHSYEFHGTVNTQSTWGVTFKATTRAIVRDFYRQVNEVTGNVTNTVIYDVKGGSSENVELPVLTGGSPLITGPGSDKRSVVRVTYAPDMSATSSYRAMETEIAWRLKISRSSPDTSMRFVGSSYACDGNTLLVGVPEEHLVYVFSVYTDTNSNDSRVNLNCILRASNPGVGTDNFGFSVAVDNDTIVVGAPQSDETSTDGGAVYVFVRYTDGTWPNRENARIVPTETWGTAAGGLQLGYKVSVSGPFVASTVTGINTVAIYRSDATNGWSGTSGTLDSNGVRVISNIPLRSLSVSDTLAFGESIRFVGQSNIVVAHKQVASPLYMFSTTDAWVSNSVVTNLTVSSTFDPQNPILDATTNTIVLSSRTAGTEVLVWSRTSAGEWDPTPFQVGVDATAHRTVSADNDMLVVVDNRASARVYRRSRVDGVWRFECDRIDRDDRTRIGRTTHVMVRGRQAWIMESKTDVRPTRIYSLTVIENNDTKIGVDRTNGNEAVVTTASGRTKLYHANHVTFGADPVITMTASGAGQFANVFVKYDTFGECVNKGLFMTQSTRGAEYDPQGLSMSYDGTSIYVAAGPGNMLGDVIEDSNMLVRVPIEQTFPGYWVAFESTEDTTSPVDETVVEEEVVVETPVYPEYQTNNAFRIHHARTYKTRMYIVGTYTPDPTIPLPLMNLDGEPSGVSLPASANGVSTFLIVMNSLRKIIHASRLSDTVLPSHIKVLPDMDSGEILVSFHYSNVANDANVGYYHPGSGEIHHAYSERTHPNFTDIFSFKWDTYVPIRRWTVSNGDGNVQLSLDAGVLAITTAVALSTIHSFGLDTPVRMVITANVHAYGIQMNTGNFVYALDLQENLSQEDLDNGMIPVQYLPFHAGMSPVLSDTLGGCRVIALKESAVTLVKVDEAGLHKSSTWIDIVDVELSNVRFAIDGEDCLWLAFPKGDGVFLRKYSRDGRYILQRKVLAGGTSHTVSTIEIDPLNGINLIGTYGNTVMDALSWTTQLPTGTSIEAGGINSSCYSFHIDSEGAVVELTRRVSFGATLDPIDIQSCLFPSGSRRLLYSSNLPAGTSLIPTSVPDGYDPLDPLAQPDPSLVSNTFVAYRKTFDVSGVSEFAVIYLPDIMKRVVAGKRIYLPNDFRMHLKTQGTNSGVNIRFTTPINVGSVVKFNGFAGTWRFIGEEPI